MKEENEIKINGTVFTSTIGKEPKEDKYLSPRDRCFKILWGKKFFKKWFKKFGNK